MIMDDGNGTRTRTRPRVFAEVAGVAILIGVFGHVFWAVAAAIGGGVLLTLPRVGRFASPLLSLGWGWAGWEAASRLFSPDGAAFVGVAVLVLTLDIHLTELERTFPRSERNRS